MNKRSFRVDGANGSDTAGLILDSAIGAFSRMGFHGASMREVASEAGVSLGNIYNYFPAKSDILLEILQRASATQMAAMLEAIEGAGEDVLDRFSAGIAAFVRFDLENPEVCFVANSELRYLDGDQRRQIVAQRDRQEEVFEQLIDEGVAAGVFRTPHPGEAARAILTMCAGVTVWYRPDGPLSAEEIARRYTRFALALVEGV
jgi:AcrR family transcriptional regulator